MSKLPIRKFFLTGFFLFMLIPGQAQQVFYHLLGLDSTPIANFTATSQNFNEVNGVWGAWPVGLQTWNYRREISVPGFGTALSDFPVMIKLDSTRINYASTLAAGADLRFTSASGTVLSHEIEVWNASGTSIIWVKIPSVPTTGTHIYMYYGNAAALDAQDGVNVWGSSHLGVWHLNGNATDSTSNAANGTVTGASSGAGLVANGVSFSGGTNSIRTTNGILSSRTVGTLSVWFKTTSTDVPLFGIATNDQPTVPTGWVPTLYVGQNGYLYAEQWMGTISQNSTSFAVNDGSWHQATMVINTNSLSLYVDGVFIGNTTGAITVPTANWHFFGQAYTTGRASTAGGWRSFNGAIDEYRISNVARSAAWIAADFQSTQDLFLRYSAEQTKSTGVAPVLIQLNQSAATNVTIPYALTGTATNGTDYVLATGSLIIPSGQSSGSLDTAVLRDHLTEGNETVIITLNSPTNAQLGSSYIHTLTIIDDVQQPPDAIDDTYQLTNFQSRNLNLLSNDTDPNNDILTITNVSTPTNGGAVTIVPGGGSVIYTPPADFGATDTFTYTISDGRGGTDTATVTLQYQIPFTWIGAGADANWETTANWMGGVVPGSSDTAYFNNQCTTYCNPNQTANISVGGVRMNSSYTGTIAQAATRTWTVGTGGWIQRAGTFTGNNAAITIGDYASGNGSFEVLGGSFTSTSSNLTIRNNVNIQGTAFVPNGGLVNYNGKGGSVQFGSTPLYRLNFTTGDSTTIDLQGTSVEVENDFSVSAYGGCGSNCRINNGTIVAKGSVSVVNDGFRGTYLIQLNGNSGQALNATAASAIGGIGSLEVKSTGGVVNWSGIVNVYRNYTFTSGNMNFGSSTLRIRGGDAATQTVIPGNPTYNNVSFFTTSWVAVDLSGGTFTLAGDLSFSSYATCGTNCAVNNGSFLVGKNISVSSEGYQGTASITMNGAAAATISAVTGGGRIPTGTFTVNKDATANTVTLLGAVNVTGTGQAFTITRGTVDMAGYNLTVGGTITIDVDGKLLCNGGTVVYGGYSVLGEVSCGPTIGTTWTGAATDNAWNTAGNWTGGIVPGSTHTALFNSKCTGANCNANMPATLSVKGINLFSTYPGTLTAGATTLTIGTDGFIQNGGTFAGSSAATSLTGPFLLSSGTHTTSSGNSTFGGNFTISGTPVFNHANGTFIFNATQSITVPSTAIFRNVTFSGSARTATLTGTMSINGNLLLSDASSSSGSINGGTILLEGDLNATNYGKNGTTNLRMVGSTNQLVTGSTTCQLPNFEVASTGGTVKYSGTLRFQAAHYLWTSGTIDPDTSTVIFTGSNASRSVTVGNETYNNVTFSGAIYSHTLSGSMKVAGTLSLADQSSSTGTLNGGEILLTGNLTATSYGKLGTTWIRLKGSSDQYVNGSSNASLPNLEIVSTGGTVFYDSVIRLNNSTYRYLSGTVNAGTSTLLFTGSSGNSTTVYPGPVSYYNVQFAGATYDITIDSPITVNGTLTFSDASSSIGSVTGTILTYGDVQVTGYGKVGPGPLRVIGNSNQNITGSANGYIPAMEIASTGGIVSLADRVAISAGDYTYTSGNIDAGTSTLTFSGNGTHSVIPGSINYNNLNFSGSVLTTITTGTWNVYGVTRIHSTTSGASVLSSGSIDAYGNVETVSYGKTGSTLFNFKGATSASFFHEASRFPPSVTVDKSTAASVVLARTAGLTNTGTTLNINSGIVNMSGYNLSVNSSLTVSASGKIICNGGTLSYGSLTNNGVIDCVSSPFNWTGSSGDAKWSTAANWAGGVVPTNTDLAVFSGANCGSNCDVNVDINPNVKGVRFNSDYRGTISQGSGIAMDIGSQGWVQESGTFFGSNGNITIEGSMIFQTNSDRATYQATSGVTNIKTNLIANGIVRFQANGGTFTFSADTGTSIISPLSGMNFHHVNISGTNAIHNLSSSNLIVRGNLTLGDSASGSGGINNGTIQAYSNVSFANFGYSGSAYLDMTGVTHSTLQVGASASTLNTGLSISKNGEVKTLSNISPAKLAISSNSVLNLDNRTLTVTNNLSLAANSILLCGASGSYSSGSLSNSGSIVCGAYGFYWSGAGGNSNWNTAGNWSGGVVPGVNDVAIFTNSQCTSCNASITLNPNVKGVMLLADYTGTISQGSGIAITVGTNGWLQSSGTFTGNNADITFNGPFALSGGTYTASSGNMNVMRDWSVSGAAVFNSGTSGLSFQTATDQAKFISPGSVQYNTVAFVGSSTNASHTILGSMNVTNLTLNTSRSLSGGPINVAGTITSTMSSQGGDAIIRTVGVNQTINGTSGQPLPGLEIASSGTVSFTGTVDVGRIFKYTSGTMNWGTSKLRFTPTTSTPLYIYSNNLDFKDVEFAGGGTDATTYLNNNTIKVLGTLTINMIAGSSGIAYGTLNPQGNYILTSYSSSGTSIGVMFSGTAAQTYSTTGGSNPGGNWTINKASGSLTLANNLVLNVTNQRLTINSGSTLNMAGFNLTVNNLLTNNGVLRRGTSPSCGTITNGSFSGTAAICP